MELFINDTGRESIAGKISLFLGGPLAAPVFMTTMGYFISLSNRNELHTIRRGALIFLLGLLLNIGLNFNLLLRIQFSGWQYDPLEYIFGVDILYLAGLSIMILALLKNTGRISGLLALLLIAGITVSTPFVNSLADKVTARNYVLPFIAGNASWSYFPLFPWLAYPLAGYWFQKNEETIVTFFNRNRGIAVTGFLIILIGIAFFSRFGFNSAIKLTTYYHHNFLLFLWINGLISIWAIALRRIIKKFPESKLLHLIRWTGKNVTLIYVIQWLIIGNLATEIYRTQSIGMFGGWFAGITMLSSSLCYIYGWIIKKIKGRFSRSVL